GFAPIPRAMFSDKDLVAIDGGKHRTCIEAHSQRSYMRAELLRRRNELGAVVLFAELGVSNISTVAVRIADVNLLHDLFSHGRQWGKQIQTTRNTQRDSVDHSTCAGAIPYTCARFATRGRRNYPACENRGEIVFCSDFLTIWLSPPTVFKGLR